MIYKKDTNYQFTGLEWQTNNLPVLLEVWLRRLQIPAHFYQADGNFSCKAIALEVLLLDHMMLFLER